MMRTTFAFFCLFVTVWLPFSVVVAQNLSTSQIISAVEPSLVSVTHLNEYDEVVGYSTGFFVSNNAVVTSLRLFATSAKATITDFNNNTYAVLSKLNDLPDYDLALVKVNYSKGKPVEFSSDAGSSGNTVFAISTLPGAGFTFNFASGKLLNANFSVNNTDLLDCQTGTRVSATGAVLMNGNAQLIGIINANITSTMSGNANGNLLALHSKYLNTLLRKNYSEPEETEPSDTPPVTTKQNQPYQTEEEEEEEQPEPPKSKPAKQAAAKTKVTEPDEDEDDDDKPVKQAPKPKPTPQKPSKKQKFTVIPPDDSAKAGKKTKQTNKPDKSDLHQALTTENNNSSNNYPGPATALYSLAVPGLGSYKMSNKKPYFWAITAAAYGLMGYGIYSKINANNQYQNYKSATLPADISGYYQKANQNHLLGSYLLTIGGVIWLADITGVAAKGLVNKKKHRSTR